MPSTMSEEDLVFMENSTPLTAAMAPSPSTMASEGQATTAVGNFPTVASPDEVNDEDHESIAVPKVGMIFESEDEAYDLREKWASVFRHDSFSADMTSTQRSEGMNNVFKKRFRRKLSISELLEECDKCATSLRENELYADYKSRHSDQITYIPNLPMLKTAAESYTRKLYSDFEEQFKEQFSLSCQLLQSEATVKTYKVVPRETEDEAVVVFNHEDMHISCSCRKYESIGLLCNHAIRVLNINEVFVLPSRYILNRWTKYAKRGLHSGGRASEEETLQTQAARISRKATSIAMKCSVSKELLTNLEDAMDKLDIEVDTSLSQRKHVKHLGASESSSEYARDTTKGKISFRVPPAVKGPKSKRARNALEKNGKKTIARRKKGENTEKEANNSLNAEEQEQFGANISASHTVSNMFPGDCSTMFVPLVQGEYTDLLLGAELQATGLVSTSRRLDFDFD